MELGWVSSPMVSSTTCCGNPQAYLTQITGVHLTLYFTCLALFWEDRKREDRRTWPWITYMTVLFITGSISTGLNMFMVKLIFLDNRNYPGGPAAFATQVLSLPNLVCAACAVIGGWLADGLLVS